MFSTKLRMLELLVDKVRGQLGKVHIEFAVRATGRNDCPFSIALSARHFVHRIEPRASVVLAYTERGDFINLVKEIRQGFLALESLLERARAEERRTADLRLGEERRCGWDRRVQPGEPRPVERRSGFDRRVSGDRRRS